MRRIRGERNSGNDAFSILNRVSWRCSSQVNIHKIRTGRGSDRPKTKSNQELADCDPFHLSLRPVATAHGSDFVVHRLKFNSNSNSTGIQTRAVVVSISTAGGSTVCFCSSPAIHSYVFAKPASSETAGSHLSTFRRRVLSLFRPRTP